MSASTLDFMTKGLRTVAWGLFCACSWTWCIGMFLPVIMIDRFGWPGFLVFAIPNVIGCAAFGAVVRNRARSVAMVMSHGRAMAWFSIVTIAYHMFFVAFMFHDVLPRFSEVRWLPAGAAAIVLGLGVLMSVLQNRDWLILAALTYAASITALLAIGLGPLERIEWSGRFPLPDLAWLAPVIIFGFLLCPYLDLTFHRALQHSPGPSTFIVFGIAFSAMLVLTCVMWYMPMRVLPAVAIAHVMLQVIFTVGAHVRELRRSGVIPAAGLKAVAIGLPLIAAVIPDLFHAARSDGTQGQTSYLRFLAFYGLVFPLYVWLFACPPAPWARNTVNRLMLFLLSLAAAPLYELGFVGGREAILVIPLAVFAAVKLLWPRTLPSPPSP